MLANVCPVVSGCETDVDTRLGLSGGLKTTLDSRQVLFHCSIHPFHHSMSIRMECSRSGFPDPQQLRNALEYFSFEVATLVDMQL